MSKDVSKRIFALLDEAARPEWAESGGLSIQGDCHMVMGDIHVHAPETVSLKRRHRASSSLQSLLAQLAELNSSQLRQVSSYVALVRESKRFNVGANR